MKKYSFPSPASQPLRLSNQITGTRAALILTLVTVLSILPFYVSAQDEAAPPKTKVGANYRIYPQSGDFVTVVGSDGNTVCRTATVDEARAISTESGTQILHQINHLKTAASDLNQVEGTNGLTIILRATQQLEANPAAKQAFINAAAKWEALIKDQITINIDVDFGPTFFTKAYNPSTIIGQTSSPRFAADGNYSDIRQRLINHANGSEGSLYAALPASSVPTDIGSVNTVFVESPLLRALGLLQPVASDTEQGGKIPAPKIGFNSAFNFDLDPSDGISPTLTDFDAVAVHEMGHALGFDSEVGDREVDPTLPLAVSVWDLFRFRPGTANLSNFNTAQRILSSDGTQVQFAGGSELGLSTGKPTDPIGGDGNQASHWKADEQSGFYIGIMDPTIRHGVRQLMTTNDQNAIDRFGYTIGATTPPPNDNFVNAQGITGTSGSVNGTNIFATKEGSEPSHSPDGNLGGRSVWYVWTAPSSGSATFTTEGSDFDTLLAVYTGSAVNALTGIVKNDDVQSGVITTSTVQFPAVGGTVYHIAVDGFDGDQGNITLNFTLPGTGTPTPTPTPLPNTVQFTASTASASETFHANTQVDLTVTRTGTTSAAASVDYASSNATASDRSDYLAALGTLQFAAGETSKTIPVLIIDDGYVENPETFNVTLSNPVSCTLGTPAAVSVTINSPNDVGGGTNPVKDPTFDNEFFVRQHYFDFLNRAPDAGGLGFWKKEIDDCGADAACIDLKRINVSAAFFLSIEFQETGYLVERIYKSAYGDANALSALNTFPAQHAIKAPIVRLNEFLADSQLIAKDLVVGVPGWPTVLENNKVAFTQNFVARSRFLTAHPTSKTPTQFVTDLNTNTGNTLSPSEMTSIIGEFGGAGNIADAAARARALRRVAENATLAQQEKNKAFVLMQYFGYLRRNPNDPQDIDHTGYDFWLHKLDAFGGNFVGADMVKAFIVSIEYQGRFGN